MRNFLTTSGSGAGSASCVHELVTISSSMVVWLIHQSGNHAIAGMWHEGTDSPTKGAPAVVQVRGQRQFGMFAGLSANPGASSAHVSETAENRVIVRTFEFTKLRVTQRKDAAGNFTTETACELVALNPPRRIPSQLVRQPPGFFLQCRLHLHH